MSTSSCRPGNTEPLNRPEFSSEEVNDYDPHQFGVNAVILFHHSRNIIISMLFNLQQEGVNYGESVELGMPADDYPGLMNIRGHLI